MITLNEYLSQMDQNLRIMSRTANGIVDVSASDTKADYMKIGSGKDASDSAFTNVRNAMTMAYGEKDRILKDSEEVKKLVTDIALTVNNGIVKDGYLFRCGHDSEKFNYVRIADIGPAFDWFCNELFSRLTSGYNDHIETACFCEYIINPVGHFFSDGCSKVSMTVSAYVLMRAGLPLPSYRGRDEYYKAIESSSRKIPTVDHIIDERAYSAFLEYYRSLF